MQRAVLVGVFTKCCQSHGCEAFIAMAQHSTDNTMNIGRMPVYIEPYEGRQTLWAGFGFESIFLFCRIFLPTQCSSPSKIVFLLQNPMFLDNLIELLKTMFMCQLWPAPPFGGQTKDFKIS
jgi:hypothetical protein